MGLMTESEKLEAFKATYPDIDKVLDPEGGLASFRILTFSPETGYAQFKNADPNLHHAEYIEFAQTTDRQPIQRDRFYSSFNVNQPSESLSLVTANIKYPLGKYLVEWMCLYQEPKDPFSSDAPIGTVYFPSPEDAVPLARYWYHNNAVLPNGIDITVATPDEALNFYRTRSGLDRWEVPLHFTIATGKGFSNYAIFGASKDRYEIKSRLGFAEPGKPFTHPEFPGALTIEPLEDGSLKIVRANKAETVLIVPKIDYKDVHERLRGSWPDYASFPQRYPVDFQIS